MYVVVAGAALALAWRLFWDDRPRPRARPARVAARALRRLDRAHVRLVARPPAGRDLPALLRAAVRPARGLALAAAVAARLGEGALRRARRDGARLRGDRRLAVPDAEHLLEPEGEGRQRVRAGELVLPGQLGVLRPVDLRALPRRRDPREPRARALRPRARGVGGARARRRDVARARAVVLAVELRRARRRDRRGARDALAPARGRAARSSRPRRSRSSRSACRRCATASSGRPGSRTRRAAARSSSRTASSSSSTTPSSASAPAAFKRGYANLHRRCKGKEPKAAASHDTPITVAAETGLPGLALLAWLVGVGIWLTFWRNPVATAAGRARLGLRTSLARDRRAQPLLQRAARGSALLGPARARPRVAKREPA